MPLIDTHTHAWGPDTAELPWTRPLLPPGWDGAYTHADLVADMDRVGVDESVVVTTPLYGRGQRANEYTMRSIEAYPDRLYGVGLMDFLQSNPETVRSAFRRVVGHDRMLGVRMHAALDYETPSEITADADWILDDRLAPVWKEAAAQDTCVFLFPKAPQLSMIGRLAGTYPDVSLVVEHMAWPDENTDPGERPWADFEKLADHNNVYVKVSSLPRSSSEDWPYRDMHPYVRNLLSWFGPERLMVGSDYPWMDDWATYEECLSWLDEATFLSDRDRGYLTHRTFEQLHL
ncbi:amidohydrolase family protein [Halomicrococcus sp. NG-SE-24]|uniref:amidohydrolase family protein n=1 Tax=Halomicrococcus sp. NG-SE-24 TaxID=3436928 RepID=UPI003D95877E